MKRQINKFLSISEFEMGNNKECKIEVIWDNIVYTKKVDKYILELYYLLIWKDYPEKKNIWKPSSLVMNLWKMVSIFNKEYLEKIIRLYSTYGKTNSQISRKLEIKMPSKRRYEACQVKAISTMLPKWQIFLSVK